jgi:hypothetical protein
MNYELLPLKGRFMNSGTSKETLRKEEIISRIMSLNDGSRLDFTRPYLDGLDVDRLKHILLYAKTMRIKKA